VFCAPQVGVRACGGGGGGGGGGWFEGGRVDGLNGSRGL